MENSPPRFRSTMDCPLFVILPWLFAPVAVNSRRSDEHRNAFIAASGSDNHRSDEAYELCAKIRRGAIQCVEVNDGL